MRSKLKSLLDSNAYSIFMMICIVTSIVPLAFHEQHVAFTIIDMMSAVIFSADYIARWITADFDDLRTFPFARYPFKPLAVIDLVSILPSVTTLSSGFRLLKIFRLLRTLRVFRAFKLARYSRNIQIIAAVFQKQRDALTAVLSLALACIVISALVIFNVEPDTFDNFFEAVYWATVSLTTMGYGDIYPVTAAGRIITMLSSLFGIAIVALPAGIVTAGYMNEIGKEGADNGAQEETVSSSAKTEYEDKKEDFKSDRNPVN